MGPPVFRTMTKENLREVLTSKENKFVYFYSQAALNPEEYKRVEEFAHKIANGMRVVPYKVNLDECFTELIAFLKERNPKTADQAEEQVTTHQFLLANQYDDIWYWEMDLINYFYGEVLEQIFNFYQGPLRLEAPEQLVLNQSGDNDFHVVAWVPPGKREETSKVLKNFRKFNTKNTDRFFHYKFWVVESYELAGELGINTADDSAGDLYLVRPAGPLNQDASSATLCGYEYSSRRILTGAELQSDVSGSASYGKILEHAFNSPIIVRDYMQFGVLTQKFKTNTLVVFCDPAKEPVRYQQVIRSMVRARQQLPIRLAPDASGEVQRRQDDVLFVVSTGPNLMPVAKLHEPGVQALFVTPQENVVDLLSTTLTKLTKIEGVSKEEFLRKALNAEKEFEYAETDDDRERNKKDTAKMIYNPERFVMPKMYHTSDFDGVISDPDKLVAFVKGAVEGALPLYWETERLPKLKHSQKVCGEDLEKRVLENPASDALLLVSHPVKAKNGKLAERFEEFARREKREDLLVGRYKGVNESASFKSPEKLPAVLYFRRQGAEPKEVIKMEDVEDLLIKGNSDEDVNEALLQFLRTCQRKQ